METITSRDKTMVDFGIGIVAMSQMLDEDRPLYPEDLRFIENNVRLLQFAYYRWKQHHPLIKRQVS